MSRARAVLASLAAAVLAGACSQGVRPDAVQCIAEKCLTYTVRVQQLQPDPADPKAPTLFTGAPRLQSFAMGRDGTRLLLLGGRLNGFHGFQQPDIGFPAATANQRMWVLDLAPGAPKRVYSSSLDRLKPLPGVFYQLQSTNMQAYQDGDTLYLAGGYGVADAAGDKLTHPRLTAVDVPRLIDAIIDGTEPTRHVKSIQDDRMAVTGGELLKLANGTFYLVMGHRFDGTYGGKFTQTYTDEIRTFGIDRAGGNLAITRYAAWHDPDAPPPQPPATDKSQYHRRDLNVEHTVLPDGSLGFGVYGGVFTPDTQLPYLQPIFVAPGDTVADPPEPVAYEQQMSQYSCATLLLYDPRSKTMATTFFGGISRSYFDFNTLRIVEETTKGNPETPDPYFDDGAPWINAITTMVREPSRPAPGLAEYVHAGQAMPAFVGSEAQLITAPGLPRLTFGDVETEIVDLSRLGASTMVGYLYGGIRAFPYPGQTSGTTDSIASDLVFEVYVDKHGGTPSPTPAPARTPPAATTPAATPSPTGQRQD